jgi:hypothetical protein
MLTKFMKIKSSANVQEACSCGSWLQHWEKFSGQHTWYCQVIACLNRDIVGARVQIAGDNDKSWYIYPLCKTHSKSSAELEVNDTFALVPADSNLTCGRPSL